MEDLDPVLKVCLFVFLVCALLYMARIEGYLRDVTAAARRIADVLERSAQRPVDSSPGQNPHDER